MSTPSTMTAVRSRAESTDAPGNPEPPTKNMEMMAMSVGNRPLQGTKLLVMMAMSRSLGRVDDAAAHDACGVAAKAHAHGQRLFAAGAALFERHDPD